MRKAISTALAALVLSLLSIGAIDARAAGCDAIGNPHSFECAEATFRGQIFPMAVMSQDLVAGPWKLLTYADVSGKPGPEFDVLVNPQNPHIPEGVVNRSDRSHVGFFDWTPNQLRMNNWGQHGVALTEIAGSTKLRDQFTVETMLKNGVSRQGLQCRIFLREQHDHLLCRWFSIVAGKAVWRGYLGFLRGQ